MKKSTELLYEACKEFIRKVDVGEAKSTKSYNQMKEAVEQYEKEHGNPHAIVYITPGLIPESVDTHICRKGYTNGQLICVLEQVKLLTIRRIQKSNKKAIKKAKKDKIATTKKSNS